MKGSIRGINLGHILIMPTENVSLSQNGKLCKKICQQQRQNYFFPKVMEHSESEWRKETQQGRCSYLQGKLFLSQTQQQASAFASQLKPMSPAPLLVCSVCVCACTFTCTHACMEARGQPQVLFFLCLQSQFLFVFLFYF